MGRLLKVIFISIFFTFTIRGPVMAENAGYRYNAMISTKGLAWILKLNDFYTDQYANAGYADAQPNISLLLQKGKNNISLLLAPLVGQDPETGKYVSKLRDGLEIEIAIKRNGWREGTKEKLDLLRIRYDEEQGKWLTLEKTYEGTQRILKTPHLHSSGQYRISEQLDHELVFNGGDVIIDAYRLDIEFTTSDYFPPFPWLTDAVELSDTPELREELRAAYRRFHGYIEKGDGEKIFTELSPVWERVAYLLTSHATAREWLDSGELGLRQYQKTRPDGYILKPLRMSDNPIDDYIQFVANNRLVYIYVAPIQWEKNGDNISFPIIFYKTRSGQWRVGDVES